MDDARQTLRQVAAVRGSAMMGKRVRLVVLAQVLLVALLWPTTTSSAQPAGTSDPGGPMEVLPFTGLINPTDVEADAQGNLYVADHANRRVVKLPAGGGPQETLPFTSIDVNYVTVAANGDVYASDFAGNKVVKLPGGGGSQVDVLTGISRPLGMDLDASGTLYVASDGCNCVYKKPSGGAMTTLGFTGLDNPSDVELDAAGNVYVGELGTNRRLLKLPVGGGPQVVVPVPGLRDPYEVVFDADGNLYLMDSTRVVMIPLSGPQSILPFVGTYFATGMAIDPFGNIYVADYDGSRVVKLPVRNGTTGQRNLSFSPKGLAVDAAGNRYAIDRLADRVVKVSPSGTETVLPFSGLSTPFGVAVDVAGNVYVTDTGNGRVLKLPPGGPQVTLGFTGLDGPSGIAVDAQGNVYVGDMGNLRVVKLPVGGGSQVTLGFTNLFGVGGVAVDSAGAVYVADAPHHTVVKLPTSGSQVTLPFTGLQTPLYVAVDRDKNVFVTDALSDVVTELAGGGDAQFSPALPVQDNPTGLAIGADGTLHVSNTYLNRIDSVTLTPPELRVTTNPAVGTDVIVDGVARDSWGLNWAQFPPGSHQVCFGEILALAKPACQTVNLVTGSTTVVQGNYTANGYLRALTSPALPSTITVGGVPRNEFGLWAEVPAGTYNVCFGAVQGYNPPACRDVVVTAGATATTTGTFTSNASAPGPTGGAKGYLRVVTDPAVGAMISIDGQWRDHWGLNWLKIPIGAHEVCFGPVLNMTAPACQTANVTTDATTIVTGSYVAKGFLRVSTNPALPGTIFVNNEVADNWGMWTGKAAGSYKVCFGFVRGYLAPACQTVNVTNGNTTNVTGTYTASG